MKSLKYFTEFRYWIWFVYVNEYPNIIAYVNTHIILIISCGSDSCYVRSTRLKTINLYLMRYFNF